MYNRTEEWQKFSQQVISHIEQYTKAQYGSVEGTEQVDNFSIEDCFLNIMRYVNRRNSNVRGDVERLRDLLKIAHYAQFAYGKLKKQLGDVDLYEQKPLEVV